MQNPKYINYQLDTSSIINHHRSQGIYSSANPFAAGKTRASQALVHKNYTNAQSNMLLSWGSMVSPCRRVAHLRTALTLLPCWECPHARTPVAIGAIAHVGLNFDVIKSTTGVSAPQEVNNHIGAPIAVGLMAKV